jgi:hypothetical protein
VPAVEGMLLQPVEDVMASAQLYSWAGGDMNP